MEKAKDTAGEKFGMWLFLYTEILLFGGLFILYAAYFSQYPADFSVGGKQLDVVLGTLNTLVLLISSFTVAASITAVRRNDNTRALLFLVSSILLGFVFLINKYIEWGHKIEIGIYPDSPLLAESPNGLTIFYGLYYVITGLHAIHVIIGMSLLLIAAILVYRQHIHRERYIFLENTGLYWHLVDLIWIFIFPLFYLVL